MSLKIDSNQLSLKNWIMITKFIIFKWVGVSTQKIDLLDNKVGVILQLTHTKYKSIYKSENIIHRLLLHFKLKKLLSVNNASLSINCRVTLKVPGFCKISLINFLEH